MSDTEITDDAGESVQLGQPYYDLMIGEFIVFEREGDQLIERQMITGDEVHSWEVEEFVRECLVSEFRELPAEVVANPERVLEEVLSRVLSDSFDNLAGYEPWEVRFAWDSTQFEAVEYNTDMSP